MFREPQGVVKRTVYTPDLLPTDLTEYLSQPFPPARPSEKTAMFDQSGVVTVTRPASPGPPTKSAAAPPPRMLSESALAYRAHVAGLPCPCTAFDLTSATSTPEIPPRGF
jgi:hypothetical protein